MAEKIGVEQIEAFQNIDLGKLFRDSFYQAKYSETSSMAFEYTEKEVESKEDISQEELLEVAWLALERLLFLQEKLLKYLWRIEIG